MAQYISIHNVKKVKIERCNTPLNVQGRTVYVRDIVISTNEGDTRISVFSDDKELDFFKTED